MKTTLLLAICIFLFTNRICAKNYIGPYMAVSEVQITHLDLINSKPLYEFGVKYNRNEPHFYYNFQTGFGILNKDYSYLGEASVGPKHSLFNNKFDLFAGLGVSYFGYVKEKMVSSKSIQSEFIHTSPIFTKFGFTANKNISVAVNGYFKSEMFWKIQLDYMLYNF